jgi:hypothetical protein
MWYVASAQAKLARKERTTMYDRTILRAAAKDAGAENPNQLAALLGLPRITAWRLWTGRSEPTRSTTAAAVARLRIVEADLLVPAGDVPASDGAA